MTVSWNARQSQSRTFSSSAWCLRRDRSGLRAWPRNSASFTRRSSRRPRASPGCGAGCRASRSRSRWGARRAELTSCRDDGSATTSDGGHDQQPASIAPTRQARPPSTVADHQPLQRQAELLVHVIDADHEAVVVEQHLVPAQEKSEAPAPAETAAASRRSAIRDRRCRRKVRRSNCARSRNLAQAVAQLPAARRQPVDEAARTASASTKRSSSGIERQVEKVERERVSENRIAPCVGLRRQVRGRRRNAPRSKSRWTRREDDETRIAARDAERGVRAYSARGDVAAEFQCARVGQPEQTTKPAATPRRRGASRRAACRTRLEPGPSPATTGTR